MRSDQTRFSSGLVEKLKVCEVNEPRGVVWHWKTCAFSFECCHSPKHSDPQDHIHFQAYVLPEPTESMVVENGLGAELLSGCGVVSACNENCHPCFLWVLNMLDFIILGSMDIGDKDQTGITSRSGRKAEGM